jgi:hypothetical protein
VDGAASNKGAEKTKFKANQHALGVAAPIQAAHQDGAATLAAIAAWLNARNVPSPRGGIWRTESVRRVLKRLAVLGDSQCGLRSRSQAQYARYEAQRQRETAARAKLAERRQELVDVGILKAPEKTSG